MDYETAAQALEILQIGRNGIHYLEQCIHDGELNMADLEVLDRVAEVLAVLERVTKDAPKPHRVRDINQNLLYYMDRLKQHVAEGQVEVFLYDFRFHFCSLFRILELEMAYLVEESVNKSDYPHLYPEVGTVDHAEIAARGAKARCKVSVILLAYNNLAYTKDCVESVLANTDDVDYEFILVDNGSTDGTKEYFESVPGAKVIHLKYNVHIVKGFNMGMLAAEGMYCAVLCNDFIFTPNWLSNLLICIESDPTVGYVSPGATSISNMQQIDIPFHSKEDFQERARAYNVSDSKKWEERVVLLPNVLCCPTALLDRIGYYDTRFFRGEFGDDDISFKIRRAGYKLIYCGDTVTHHYGSLTTMTDHQTNSLEEGRQTFIEKYGLDAWTDARMNMAYMHIGSGLLEGVSSILGIDVKCGATLLQIKNRIWSEHGVKPQVLACTTEQKYERDLQSISQQVFLLEHLKQLPKELAGKLDLVYMERPLDEYGEDLDVIFGSLARVMHENGKLICMMNNPVSLEALYGMLNGSNAMHNRKVYMQGMVEQQAREYGFQPLGFMNFIPQRSPLDSEVAQGLATILAGGQEAQAQQMESRLLPAFGMHQMVYWKGMGSICRTEQ